MLDTLKIAKASLVGLSAGSTTALDAALEYPSRVERIPGARLVVISGGGHLLNLTS